MNNLHITRNTLISLIFIAVGCTSPIEPITTAEPSDQGLKRVLEFSISDLPQFRESQIKVDVVDRHVSLSGFVDSVKDREILENIVRTTGGVASFTNKVIAKGPLILCAISIYLSD